MFRALKIDDKKAQSLVSWAIKRPRAPQSVIMPLRCGSEPAAEACVETGQHVRAGEKIADALAPGAVNRHAPFAGKVTRMGYLPHPVLGETPGIEIHGGDFPESFTSAGPAVEVMAGNGRDRSLLPFFRDMGLVDLDAAMQPLHTKIAEARGSALDVLMINGCDPEPYITSNHALAMSHALEILKGAEILRQAAGARHLVLAFQKNQMEAAEIVRSKIFFLRWEHAEVVIQPSAYPYGLNDLVLWHVLGTNARGAAAAKHRALVLNLATAFAVYEAVEQGKPLIERAVTIGGECVVEAKNVCVPLGTRLEEAFRFCGGLLRDPGRVLINGPMAGQAQTSLEVPVLPGTAALLALAKEITVIRETLPCDRCGLCVEICPSDLAPAGLVLAAERGEWQDARAAGIEHCIECGGCAFICPSRLPMAHFIHQAKAALGPVIRSPRSGGSGVRPLLAPGVGA